MDRAQGGGLDVWLMRVLLALLTECSVSKAADFLGRPQPTISLALRRLREILDDPILVRSGNTLVPTDRGLQLKDSVEKILHDVETTLLPQAAFEPERPNQRFHLTSANCFGPGFVPGIVKRIRDHAPLSVVDISPFPRFESIGPLLAAGITDLVIGNWASPPPELRMFPLLSSEIVGLVHERHPLASQGRLSAAQYLQADHLSLGPSQRPSMSPVDARLSQLGLSRRISVSVPEYSVAPYTLLQTDLIFTTGRHFAQQVLPLLPLKLVELPSEFGSIVSYMLWHERNHHSAAHRWLRSVVKAAARDVEAVFLDDRIDVGTAA